MKILIVRVSSLGDVVHNMPMVQDIVQHYPDAQIDWVVEEAYVGLVRLQPRVARIIPVALRRWRKHLFARAVRAEIADFRRNLKSVAYDLVLESQGLFKTGLIMSWARLAPGGRKVGLANATEDSGYEAISRLFHDQSVLVDRRCHAVTRAREVAAAALGYCLSARADFGLQQTRFADSPAWLPAQPYAVFFHGTARASKKWPVANWVELGTCLLARGWVILLPWGSEAEQQEALALQQQIGGQTRSSGGEANASGTAGASGSACDGGDGGDGIQCNQRAPNSEAVRVLPRLSMQEAVHLAQAASLVVGVDTGLTHVAAAFERPTIELYCDSPRWKTEGNWSDRIINLGDAGQAPTVAEVKAALSRLPLDATPAV